MLGPKSGTISGQQAKTKMVESKLPSLAWLKLLKWLKLLNCWLVG